MDAMGPISAWGKGYMMDVLKDAYIFDGFLEIQNLSKPRGRTVDAFARSSQKTFF